MRLLFWIILAIPINNFFLLTTDSISKNGPDNKLIVYTVNYPLQYFTLPIAMVEKSLTSIFIFAKLAKY